MSSRAASISPTVLAEEFPTTRSPKPGASAGHGPSMARRHGSPIGLYFILGLSIPWPSSQAACEIGGMATTASAYSLRAFAPPPSLAISTRLPPRSTRPTQKTAASIANSSPFRKMSGARSLTARRVRPLLFGRHGPGTAAMERHAKHLPPPERAPDSSPRAGNGPSPIASSLNRTLLNRLRPVALGRSTLDELITELRSRDLQAPARRHPVRAPPPRSPSTYGEAIDLALYRCVQEGLSQRYPAWAGDERRRRRVVRKPRRRRNGWLNASERHQRHSAMSYG